MTRTIRMKDIAGLKANTTTAPYATTEPAKIGGVRGGGAAPPPSGSLPADWNDPLFYVGPGTTDPTFDPVNDITYLGAFRLAWTSEDGSDGNSTRDFSSFAYDRSTDTFFFGKYNLIGRFSIPALSTSDNLGDLNFSIKVQTLNTYVDKLPISDNTDADVNDRLGWMKVLEGKLYLSGYAYYDGTAARNYANIAVCDNPYNFDTANWGGWIDSGNGDYGASYVFDIPTSKQATFGSYSHFMGVNADLAIVGRSSLGHALLGFNLGSLTVSSTATTSTIYTHYPLSNPIEGYSNYNAQVRDYYGNLVLPVGTTWEQYLELTPDSRVNDLSGYTKPDPSLYENKIGFASNYPIGFIPEGSNSIVFLGVNSGSRYGKVYKSRNLEYIGGKSDGPSPISAKDRDNMIWTMNLDDVAGAANSYDPSYSYCGVFNGNKWLLRDENNNVIGGAIITGEYDRVSGKLYVVHGGFPDSNAFNKSFVVAVYQIGGGV